MALEINKQQMRYALQGKTNSEYETDSEGNILYVTTVNEYGDEVLYLDDEGEPIPLKSGGVVTKFSDATIFYANINNKLNEVLAKDFGIDDSTNYAQIVADKGELPLKAGDLVWKTSDVIYKSEGVIDENSADYVVKGVATEGLKVDLFLLQRIVK